MESPRRSYTLLQMKDEGKLSPLALARGITPQDCHEAYDRFGINVAIQRARDLALYSFWDSASMIEQGWQDMAAKGYVEDWVAWVLEKLKNGKESG